jgi:hypothetical protein
MGTQLNRNKPRLGLGTGVGEYTGTVLVRLVTTPTLNNEEVLQRQPNKNYNAPVFMMRSIAVTVIDRRRATKQALTENTEDPLQRERYILEVMLGLAQATIKITRAKVVVVLTDSLPDQKATHSLTFTHRLALGNSKLSACLFQFVQQKGMVLSSVELRAL